MCHVRVPVSQKIAFPMEFPPPSDVSPPKTGQMHFSKEGGEKREEWARRVIFKFSSILALLLVCSKKERKIEDWKEQTKFVAWKNATAKKQA